MKNTLLALAVGLAGFGMSCGYAQAQTLIDQNKALAGGITPGDTPGFPITLSQPGSYKLTSNLTVPAGMDGIVMAVDGITLDLNGYTIAGPIVCTRTGSTVSCPVSGYTSGVRAELYSTGIGSVVRNGSVKGFKYGVWLEYGRAEQLVLSHNYSGLTSNRAVEASHISARMNEIGMSVSGGVVQGLAASDNTYGVAMFGVTALINSHLKNNWVGANNVRFHAVSAVGNSFDFVGSSAF